MHRYGRDFALVDCFLVVKDGELVHEQYYANHSSTTYETDSLAKTMVAQLVGVAVTKGLLDLDTPISQCQSHGGRTPSALRSPLSKERG